MSRLLASLNGRALRSESKCARLSRDLHRLGVDACCVQEDHLIVSDYKCLMSRRFRLFSVYFDRHSTGVSWLVSRFLDATCALVFEDPTKKLCSL